jgi:hypothetical protein
VYRDRDMGAQSLQQAQLIGAESVELAMGSGENSDQIAFALQRDGDFGTRIVFARHVVRVASDVGGVVHFARGRHVPHHSFTNGHAMALAVNRAAADSGQHEFLLLGIAQK